MISEVELYTNMVFGRVNVSFKITVNSAHKGLVNVFISQHSHVKRLTCCCDSGSLAEARGAEKVILSCIRTALRRWSTWGTRAGMYLRGGS